MAIPGVRIIGDRIDSGFRSTRQMYDSEDLDGIQALAVRQAEAGAAYLNVNVGRRAKDDPEFMANVIRHIQAVVDLPLAFDFPELGVQQVCLEAYEPGKARGEKPIINSLAETRWEMTEITRDYPVKIIVMASEQLVNGQARQNKSATDIHETASRTVLRLLHENNMDAADIIVDVSISTLAADMEGLTAEVIESVRRIGEDPELAGIHIGGGLFNLGQQLPPTSASGIKLRQAVENAFLSLTVPHGFDTILGTPWKDFHLLNEEDPVLSKFREIIAVKGRDALRRMLELRKL